MSNSSDQGGRPSEPPQGPGSSLPIGRVALLLILFIVATAVLVGQLHPSKATTASSATATTATTTATTTPGSPTTAASSPTTTKPKSSTTTGPTTPPAKVTVLVANGSTVSGEATRITAQLHAAGWDTLPPVNSATNVSSSTVYYAPGFQPSATSIASSLGVPASQVQPLSSSVPVSSVAGADVVVVIGPDVANRSSASTTTAAPTATTKAK